MHRSKTFFHLSDEQYDRFAELLGPCGITVRDRWRETREDLEKGKMEYEDCGGYLLMEKSMFGYTRRRYYNVKESIPAEFPVRGEFFDTGFSVNIGSQSPDNLAELFRLLDHVFPAGRPQPRVDWKPRPWTIRRIKVKLGCVLVSLIFIAICVLLLLGVRSLFQILS